MQSPRATASSIVLLAYVFGTCAGQFVPVSPLIWTLTAAPFLLLLLRQWWPFVVTVCTLLAIAIGWYHSTHWRQSLSPPAAIGSTVTVSGTIRDQPQLYNGTVRVVIANTNYHSAVIAYVPVWPPVARGDFLEVTGKLEPITQRGTFNYPAWLAAKGIVSQIRFSTSVVVTPRNPHSLIAILDTSRAWVAGRIQSILPNPEASFLQGLLLGDDSELPQSLQDAFQATGTGHLTAISGANIAIVLGILAPLLPFKKSGQQLLGTFGIAFGLAIMTGGSASIVRGATVVCLSGLVSLLGLPGNPLSLLSLSLFLLTVGNPLAPSFDPSFQLSFAAFAGLGFLGKPVENIWNRFLTWVPNAIAAPTKETIAASLGSIPVAGIVMGQWNWYGIIVNPLVLPFIPLATASGGLLCFAIGLESFTLLPTWILLTTPLKIISLLGGAP